MTTEITIDLYPEEAETIARTLEALELGSPLDAWMHLVALEGLLTRIAQAQASPPADR